MGGFSDYLIIDRDTGTSKFLRKCATGGAEGVAIRVNEQRRRQSSQVVAARECIRIAHLLQGACVVAIHFLDRVPMVTSLMASGSGWLLMALMMFLAPPTLTACVSSGWSSANGETTAPVCRTKSVSVT